MKKKFIGLFLFAALVISYSFTNIESNNQILNSTTIENDACKYGQCHATAQSTGNRCLHCVSNSGDYTCYQH